MKTGCFAEEGLSPEELTFTILIWQPSIIAMWLRFSAILAMLEARPDCLNRSSNFLRQSVRPYLIEVDDSAAEPSVDMR